MKLLIVFATGNENKVREVHEILGDPEIRVITMKEAGLLTEPEENGESFEENALIKAWAVAELLEKNPSDAARRALAEDIPVIVLSDDSGLCVDALDGAPGIYSARYLGRDTSYPEKMHHIMAELKDLPDEERGAQFVDACACVIPASSLKYFDVDEDDTTELGAELVVRGVMEGRIAREIKGENGFGYDPFFYLPEYGMSSAEISPDEKNAISHRGKAFRGMLERLSQMMLDKAEQSE